jgi:DNA-binding MarR family transcriptional regulator
MPDDTLALERYIPLRLSVLAHRLTRAVARVYSARFHLSAPEWRTMAVLGHYGAMGTSAVAEHAEMDKVSLSRAVGGLLAAGYIVQREAPGDRRRVILDLTPAGSVIYQQIVPLIRAVEAETLAVLNGEERAIFERAVDKLEAAAGRLLGRGKPEHGASPAG